MFHVKGQLPAGRHFVSATATSNGETFLAGWMPITYAHIRPLRYYRMASVQIEAVDAQLPRNPQVAYIKGVSDNVAPMLYQLGIRVTCSPPELLATADLVALRRGGGGTARLRGDAAARVERGAACGLRAGRRHGGGAVRAAGDAGAGHPSVSDHAEPHGGARDRREGAGEGARSARAADVVPEPHHAAGLQRVGAGAGDVHADDGGPALSAAVRDARSG